MSLAKYQWIRKYGKKMDADLRSSLMQRLTILRWIPCTFHRQILPALHSFQRLPVLVQLNPNVVVTSSLKKQLHVHHSPHANYYNSIHTYQLELTMNQLQDALACNEVKQIYLDRKVYALLDKASSTVQAPLAWQENNRGENTTIAVIDTGIAPHPDLIQPQSRIIAFKDFIKNKKKPYDDNGHGTHCAGDAAGNGYASNGKYQGPAPGAKLIGIKVLTKEGSGYLSDVIGGIQWCITHKEKYNIGIISLSLGSRSTTSYQDDPVAQIVEKAWKQGIVVVAAAGNDGPSGGTLSSPGNHPQIITVGASNDRNSKERESIASFSSRGPTLDGVTKPDVVAPGTSIVSLRVKRSYIDRMSPETRIDNHYCALSGTSMATPIVAGLAALLLTRHPHWNPDQVKKALTENAKDLETNPNSQGAGSARLPFNERKGKRPE